MAKLQSEVKARVEAAASRTIENFRALEEYKDEKFEFAIDAYDKGKCFV